MRRKIDYKNLVYNFTSKASGSIYFIKFKGPFGHFKEIKEGDISLKMAEKDQEKFKKELDQIKSGNPKHNRRNSYIQEKTLNIFTTRDKTLLIHLTIPQKLNLNLFIGQNMMTLK